MRRATWLLLIIAASTGLIALILGGGDMIGERENATGATSQIRGWLVPAPTTPQAMSESVRPDTPNRDLPAPALPPIPNEVRDVTPATVTPPPAISGPLTRVAPPEKPPAPAEPWRAVVFHRPTVSADLTMSARPPGPGGARTTPVEIRLEGIDALAEDAVCKDALGDAGPCRTVAAAALRALIGARGITCQSPRRDIPSPLVTTCRLGARDLGGWLIERGYARGTSPGTDQPSASANPG